MQSLENIQACCWPVEELISHSGDKILLCQILGYNEGFLEAEARVKPDSVYLRAGVEPPWLGLEYMAQAVAAYAGIRQRLRGSAPKVGMLIGTRKYQCNVADLPVGLRFRVRVQSLLEDDQGLSVFQCQMFESDNGEPLAEANLNVYQPPDINDFLESKIVDL